MKKIIALLVVAASLSGCVGLVEGKSKRGTTYDMYLLHPVLTITGYTSKL